MEVAVCLVKETITIEHEFIILVELSVGCLPNLEDDVFSIAKSRIVAS